jgi:uncharacterized protein YwqG
MTDAKSIKNQLAKRATTFTTGGFKPTNSVNESWIGRVYLYAENEEIPKDDKGNLMLPLMQLCFEDLPFVPSALSDIKVATIFIAADLPFDLTENGANWLIRTYKKTDELIVKELTNENSHIKAFPLKPKIIEEDYPVWDDCGIPDEIEDEILELENSGAIEDYYDMVENNFGHKVGGYPTFCQSGIYFGDDFEFLIQVSSDEKANLNIVDNGIIFLAKNSKTDEWRYYCDFY